MNSSTNHMRAVLLGPPNAGKGVAGEYLTKVSGIKCVSTGQLLRAEMENGTEIGLKLKPELDKGHFAPDSVVEELVLGFLKQNDSFALDGFPRNIPQARFLQEQLDKMGRPLNIVIYMNTSDDVIVERAVTRLTCSGCRRVTSTRHTTSTVCEACGGKLFRRPDDTEEIVRERLVIYREQTEPLLSFYSQLGLVEEIEAGGTIPELCGQLDKILSRFE